jgi:hypothetical protein
MLFILALNYSFQANANNLMFGGAYAMNLNYDEENPVNVYMGAWARFNNVTDAIIPYVGLEFGDVQFGASYDVNISSLQPASICVVVLSFLSSISKNLLTGV